MGPGQVCDPVRAIRFTAQRRRFSCEGAAVKILVCCPQAYYSGPDSIAYEYESFVHCPRRMGHRVHHFPYIYLAAAGREAMNDFFLSIVRNGGYDLVFVATGEDEFIPGVLDEARAHAVTVAWNADDDWRWEDYSSKLACHYSFMVTTYRDVYEANRRAHPNLLLSQWGCTGLHEGTSTAKDIDFSFVGLGYGQRLAQIERLRDELGLIAYGRNVGAARGWKGVVKRRAARFLGIAYDERSRELPNQQAVKQIWNRTKVSFTPLEASEGHGLQIKGRVFDMGLSGTVMLCTKNPALHEFYEPDGEFVEYETLEECVDKARFLLAHERERSAITRRYYERTKAEHLWEHRFEALFKVIGLPPFGKE